MHSKNYREPEIRNGPQIEWTKRDCRSWKEQESMGKLFYVNSNTRDQNCYLKDCSIDSLRSESEYDTQYRKKTIGFYPSRPSVLQDQKIQKTFQGAEKRRRGDSWVFCLS